MASKSTNSRENVKEITDADARQVALDKALKKITKEFGDGAVMKMGEKSLTNVEVVSTGILSLDAALGVGGFPRGRVIEIYGPESSGKTTIALQAVASVQKQGGIAAYVDAENAMDPTYAKALGVNIDELLLSQPDTGEQGLAITDALVSSGAVQIVVVDSVAALTPKAEIDGEIGDQFVGLQARMMSQALRKLTAQIFKSQTIVIFINQIREKVGVMFGNPETTPGGRALKFYSTIRLEVRGSKQIKVAGEDDPIGKTTTIKVVKNKVAPPFKKIETTMTYGHGIEPVDDMLNLAVNHDVIKKSGSWYSYKDERLGQGAPNAVNFLREHPDMLDEITTKMRKLLFDPEPEADAEATKDDKSTDKKKPASKPATKADDPKPETIKPDVSFDDDKGNDDKNNGDGPIQLV